MIVNIIIQLGGLEKWEVKIKEKHVMMYLMCIFIHLYIDTRYGINNNNNNNFDIIKKKKFSFM